MEYKRFGSKFVVRLDKGEEIVASLKALCQENNIKLGMIYGIGATDKAVVGLFDTSVKEYFSRELTGDMEITCLLGNVSEHDGEVYLHLHITLADENQGAYGGHLNSAVISATGEIVIDVLDGEVGRLFDDQIGINLLEF